MDNGPSNRSREHETGSCVERQIFERNRRASRNLLQSIAQYVSHTTQNKNEFLCYRTRQLKVKLGVKFHTLGLTAFLCHTILSTRRCGAYTAAVRTSLASML